MESGPAESRSASRVCKCLARRLIAQPDRSTKAGTRDYAILALMLYTAARTIEVHRADVNDLTTQGGKLVLLVQGKGHIEKDDMLVLVGPAENALTPHHFVRKGFAVTLQT